MRRRNSEDAAVTVDSRAVKHWVAQHAAQRLRHLHMLAAGVARALARLNPRWQVAALARTGGVAVGAPLEDLALLTKRAASELIAQSDDCAAHAPRLARLNDLALWRNLVVHQLTRPRHCGCRARRAVGAIDVADNVAAIAATPLAYDAAALIDDAARKLRDAPPMPKANLWAAIAASVTETYALAPSPHTTRLRAASAHLKAELLRVCDDGAVVADRARAVKHGTTAARKASPEPAV